MYKALDVREYNQIDCGTWNTNSLGTVGDIRIKQTYFIIVIAEDTETHLRKRIALTPGKEMQIGSDVVYAGYQGDFNLIVPGDYFTINETATFKKVTIVNKDFVR